jgi:hypothetical protein
MAQKRRVHSLASRSDASSAASMHRHLPAVPIAGAAGK